MKILILGFTKIKYMPYVNFYLENLNNSKNEIHILYWNRDLKDETLQADRYIYHEFRQYQEDDVRKIKKIRSFIAYRNYAVSILESGHFDKVIVLHSLPGVILYQYLIRHFSEKYIFDFRDLTYENIPLFKRLIGKLVEHSAITFVSSDAFRKFLPNSQKIYTSHNILLDSLHYREVRSALARDHLPIRIAFWGFIRHRSINETMIHALANDCRFELHYYGRKQAIAIYLEDYCAQNKISNVFFHGEYQPQDRYDFASQTDILHNLYENDTQTINAMGNKFYDGLIFRIPQLCTQGSFMAEQAQQSDVGFACNPMQRTFADDVFQYYKAIKWNDFNIACDKMLNRFLGEYNDGREKIKSNFQL